MGLAASRSVQACIGGLHPPASIKPDDEASSLGWLHSEGEKAGKQQQLEHREAIQFQTAAAAAAAAAATAAAAHEQSISKQSSAANEAAPVSALDAQQQPSLQAPPSPTPQTPPMSSIAAKALQISGSVKDSPTKYISAGEWGSASPSKIKDAAVWRQKAPEPPAFARRTPLAQATSPSSLARNQQPKRSPSQRARFDEMRAKARDVKRGVIPGPGHYDQKQVESNTAGLYGSSSFRSKSLRMVDPPGMEHTDVGDPGAYHPTEGRELAAVAKASFGRSGSSGHGAFGSAVPRETPLQIMGEDTPGPSDYNPDKTRPTAILSAGDGRGAACSAFRSTSAQRLPPPLRDNPGPADYDVQLTQVVPIMGNPVTSKAGRDSRFVGDFITNVGSETDTGVAPGAYDPQVLMSGEHATLARAVSERAAVHGEHASISSDVMRNVLAWFMPGRFGELSA
jgi:hypothetical protein